MRISFKSSFNLQVIGGCQVILLFGQKLRNYGRAHSSPQRKLIGIFPGCLYVVNNFFPNIHSYHFAISQRKKSSPFCAKTKKVVYKG